MTRPRFYVMPYDSVPGYGSGVKNWCVVDRQWKEGDPTARRDNSRPLGHHAWEAKRVAAGPFDKREEAEAVAQTLNA